jgi:hypothetical protein
LRWFKRPLTNNVESGYLTLVKTNLGFTHQGIVRLWLVGRLSAPVRERRRFGSKAGFLPGFSCNHTE